MSKVLPILIAMCLPFYAEADCTVFQQEAEAYSGVVPRFSDDGTIKSILMYGEASFVVDKRSLIQNARRRAELQAKRDFSEFLQSKFDSETVATTLVAQTETTDGLGNTDALVVEMANTLDTMQSSTSAVLSGIVKLDECVDKKEKIVMVSMGWKPEMSDIASEASNDMKTPALAVGAEKNKNNSKSEVEDNKPLKSGTKIIVIESEATSINLADATSEALRLAVAQVHGQAFASNTIDYSAIAQMNADSSLGVSVNASIDTNSTISRTESSTKGIISQWRYLQKEDTSEGYKVILEVSLPKVQSSIDPNKAKIVIVNPKFNTRFIKPDESLIEFADIIHQNLEEIINNTRVLTVLDRKFTSDINNEIYHMKANANVNELAKIGQQVGADFLLIPVIDRFEKKQDIRQIGNNEIERDVFNIKMTTRLIEVATSNLITTRSFPIRNRKLKPVDSNEQIAFLLSQKVGQFISTRFGGGMSMQNSDILNEKPTESLDSIRKRINTSMKDKKKEISDEW
jgi:hypothetical protein